MKAWLLAAISGTPAPIPVTFTSNATWTAPVFVNTLAKLTGKGGAGRPEDYDLVQMYSRTTTTYNYYPSTGQTIATDNGTTYHSGSPPADYCQDRLTLPSGVQTWNCYTHADASYEDYDPPTTGASATAFGKTFPGGYGGPASDTTFDNVAVTPGATYNIVVPLGGSVTLTYYR